MRYFDILRTALASGPRKTLHLSVPKSPPAFSAVIFDKDGTLLCFNSMWLPWAKNVASGISEKLGIELKEDILKVLGVCSRTHDISSGLLAEGTKRQILNAIIELLVIRGIHSDFSKRVVHNHLESLEIHPEHITQLHDLKDLFSVLRQQGIKIGVCTSDSRASTLKSLADFDILELVDVILCGDDPDGRPKPDPHNARVICEKLNLGPDQIAMVGDTPTDINFAKNGRFGLAVGVLSGVGRREDLLAAWYGSRGQTMPTEATSNAQFCIIPSVADIIPLLLPNRPVPVHSDRSTPVLRLAAARSTGENLVPPGHFRLIIVDKNGTLTNVHPRWSTWSEEMSSRVKQRTSAEISRRFLDLLGYSPDTRRTSGGMLAENSLLDIRECLICLLSLNGYDLQHATDVVDELWFVPQLDANDLVPGAVESLKEWKKCGLIVALNSSDSRAACDSFLRHAALDTDLDLIFSAEDAGHHPKPLPHTVQRIMNILRCDPSETVVIGDCPADMISGRSAGVGFTVGVLSGFSLAHNLLPHADALIPDITHFKYLIDSQTNV